MENEEITNVPFDEEPVDIENWDDVESEALEELNAEDTPIESEEVVEEIKEDNEEPVEEVKEEVVDTPVDDFALDIIYNGERKTLSKDEAIINAQKGMNYDKLLDKYENDRARKFVQELAEREGKTVDEYIDLTNENIKDFNIKQLAEEEGISIEVARELYEVRNSQKTLAREKEIQEAKEANKQKDFNDFLTAYPNVLPEEIPASVWDEYSKGTPLKYAYMSYENEQLKTNNKQLKTNATNRQQEVTVGSSNTVPKQKEAWETIWDED